MREMRENHPLRRRQERREKGNIAQMVQLVLSIKVDLNPST